MAKIGEVQEISIEKLVPYENNAKIHSQDQVDKIASSITEFGFLNPVLIDEHYNVVAGHGRLLAMKQLGRKTVPCLFAEGLTEDQRRAYILADNKLTELGEWDLDLVDFEIQDINIDMSAFGFDIGKSAEWFENHERFDDSREEGNDEYNEFLDKFEQPKTTDDCYTPDNIYEVVADYVASHFNRKEDNFVRPFYPGGDYQTENYPAGCTVVDNPPFSILSEIVGFYKERGVKFFLFCPGLLSFNYLAKGVCVYPVNATIIYENGATVRTGFLTNLYEDGTIIDNDPEFSKTIEEENKKNQEMLRRNLPKYEYPYDVLTAAAAMYLCRYGEHIKIKNDECALIRKLDAQTDGSGIYGCGALLSERAAAERAAAERAAAERAAAERAAAERAAAVTFQLSDREKELQKTLR